jgi:hypothetical protein
MKRVPIDNFGETEERIMGKNGTKSSILDTRSTVAFGMRLGTISLKTLKEYDRKRAKQELRRKIRVENW